MNSKPLSLLSLLACWAFFLGCGESATPRSGASSSPTPAIATNSVSLGPSSDERREGVTSTPPVTGDQSTSKEGETPPPLDLPQDPNATVDATFDHLKFDIEPDAKFEESMLTPTIHKLFDRNVRIRGYMYPTLKKRGLKQFILVRDNQECCFGPGAALFDCILVHMKPGKTAEYSIRPVAVEGKFKYEVFLDYDGTTRAIYRLDGESVE